ncbi:unnamed protein product [Victoria cruziana]
MVLRDAPRRSLFDGLPISADRSYLKEDLTRIDEGWTAARFDSLPHVVHILTSKDREGEIQFLKEQSDIVEEVVDEVVHAYHSGFNKAIQNYSQILRLFSESTESIGSLKIDLAESKKFLGSRNKQLHQLWYRSVTLRHVISLLDQIENVSKVPSQIEKFIAEKQLYAAVQLHVQSALILEREGLQGVGALQDVRSELTKLRGVLFFKVLEELHNHIYNKGEYNSASNHVQEMDEEIPSTVLSVASFNSSHPVSRRTKGKADNYFDSPAYRDGFQRPSSVDGSSFDGHDDESAHAAENIDGVASDSSAFTGRANEANGLSKDFKAISHRLPAWLENSTPNEFIESIKKSDSPLHVKYLHTMVECLCMLGKVAAAGAMLCQRLRPSVHEIITSKIKSRAADLSSSRQSADQTSQTPGVVANSKKVGVLESYYLLKQKSQTEAVTGAITSVSPVSLAMAPIGAAQALTQELLISVLNALVQILENHVVVGSLLETKGAQVGDMSTPKTINGDVNWGPDSETNQATGGYSVGFSLAVLQSECQQLICEILRATPEAASADAAVQTARLANKAPSKEKRNKADGGLSFAFRFTDAAVPVPNQGADAIRQGWGKRNTTIQEGYGTSAILPEQGIYLVSSIYRPVLQFTDKVASLLPKKYSQLGNDGLQAFVENFLKDHFLPAMFVDYRKCVQQAISSPAAFRPRTHATSVYTPLVSKGRLVLQGLLAIDFLAKEVLCWAQAMPKYAGELVEYVQTFLERAYERCRTSYMEAVLEKQSYKLMGRQDIENLMKHEPASACLSSSSGQGILEQCGSDAETVELEMELSNLLLNLLPIKQENLIRDDHKFILLASLSDSLEYLADSIERLGQSSARSTSRSEKSAFDPLCEDNKQSGPLTKSLASLANEYRSLSIECLKVLRVEMQLETIFHLQEMAAREYMEDQDAEEPDDFIITLTAQITRRDEEIAPFVAEVKRSYIFGGICSVAANMSIKALAEMKSVNLFGVQQICRNSIALEQALAAIPSLDSKFVQQRLDRSRTYFELLNLPFEALLAFISEHRYLFTEAEFSNLLKVNVPGREIPIDAIQRVSEIFAQ